MSLLNTDAGSKGSMKGFAVTVAVAEPDTDGNGMVYDFAALKVSAHLIKSLMIIMILSLIYRVRYETLD